VPFVGNKGPLSEGGLCENLIYAKGAGPGGSPEEGQKEINRIKKDPLSTGSHSDFYKGGVDGAMRPPRTITRHSTLSPRIRLSREGETRESAERLLESVMLLG